MVNFPNQIPDYDSHIPTLLDTFLSSDASICSKMAFSLQDAPFHRIAYDYSCADWGSLCDHLRHTPWEDVFKLSASTAAGEFWQLVQVEIDVYILHLSIRSSLTHLHGFELPVQLPQSLEITFFHCINSTILNLNLNEQG